MALSIIIEYHIPNILLIRIRINVYLLLPLVYPILLNKMSRNGNWMLATKILTYLRNHLYLHHLYLLLYFTPENHNGELVWRRLLLPPSWNLTKYLLFPTTLCNTQVIYFLNLIENTSLISSSSSPNLDFTTVPTIILFPLSQFLIWEGRVVTEAEVGIEGFMVSSVGRRFFVGRFGCLVA